VDAQINARWHVGAAWVRIDASWRWPGSLAGCVGELADTARHGATGSDAGACQPFEFRMELMARPVIVQKKPA